MVEKVCGTPKEQFLKVAEMISTTATADRSMTVMYALGWTQHSLGTQMIRTGAMVQLLLGNIGVSGGGMNALGAIRTSRALRTWDSSPTSYRAT